MGQMGQTRCNGNFDWSGRAKPDHVGRDGGGERRAAGTSHWDLHLRVMSARAAPSIHTSLKTRRRRMIVCFVFNFRKEKKNATPTTICKEFSLYSRFLNRALGLRRVPSVYNSRRTQLYAWYACAGGEKNKESRIQRKEKY